MKEHFAEQLEDLRRNLILLGGEVERQIQHAIEALIEADEKKAEQVIASDNEIDRMEMTVEDQAVQLLALQQPVAVDLRFLVAALKINNDLERIGDHAVNIAEGALRLSGRELLTYMAEHPSPITYCLELISISKNLERVGDLATNICEDTIFIAEARWVKHHATELTQ